jgi:hypothetical protein
VRVRRDNARQHVSFGAGPHHCLGASLARLEASTALDRMIGDGWRHYRGDGITAKAEPYDAGHPAVIGWRAATAADSGNVVR